MAGRGFALAGTVSLLALGWATVPAHAASPSSQTLNAAVSGQTVTWTGGPLVGNPDPVGPPAPACAPGQCDQETIQVQAPAGFTAANVIDLTATVKTDPASGPQSSGWDIGILDSQGNLVSGSGAGTNPDAVTAHDIQPGTYTVEVDGDIGSGDTYDAAATVTSSPYVPPPPPPSYGDGGITFSTPTVVDPVHTWGEPSIGISPSGDSHVFSSGPTGTGTQRSMWEASVDGGHSFREISANQSPNSVEGTNQPPGGGDTDIAFSHTGTQYFSDLYALTCLRVATTPDDGKTVQQNSWPGGCGGNVPTDRQWYAVFDPPKGVTSTSPYIGPRPLVYLEANCVAACGGTGQARWELSLDGLNFTNAAPHPVFGADGYPAIDQVTGDVFQANYSGTSILLNVGCPNAGGFLAFLDSGGCASIGKKPITVATGVVNDSGEAANFVVSSMDSGRNLWVAWVGRGTSPRQRQVWVSVASAATNWTVWSPPVQVSAPPSEVSVFPWIKAGGPGRADVVWYGSSGGTHTTDSRGVQQPPDPSTDAGQSWNVYMSQVAYATGAGGGVVTSAAPNVFQTRVSPHPTHYNSICLEGTACIASEGNRNLADFFEVTSDNTGAAEIVYDDTSNGLLQQGAPQSNQVADHAGAPLVTIARQSAGPGLDGLPVSGPSSAPVSGMRGASGDALYPVIGGTDVPALDLTGSSLSLSGGQLTVSMKAADVSGSGINAALQSVGGPFLQYVTRWQMGNTIYYALAETTLGGQWTFSAGTAQSIDLCSVSACDPHVIYFPESGPGAASENGSVTCPATPSTSSPCTISISVGAADVGNPSSNSLLEEVGAYSFAASHPQAAITNAQAQADNVPIEVDGICCYNFAASPAPAVPEFPVAPGLLLAAFMAGSTLYVRRRPGRIS